MKPHWTLDEIEWDLFDASRVETETLKAIKAAAMVEFNATDYVTYLRQVFGSDSEMMPALEQWGREEVQHGRALARWATLADPEFDFEDCFARFRAGYRLPLEAPGSVRGSRAGEMIARCVVESGTSSYYSALRDATSEPVLKQITALIASDEFRHYRLFFEAIGRYQPSEKRPVLDRIRVAFGRVHETEDDELAYAYYCANVRADEVARTPYERTQFSREYNQRILRFYQPRHVQKGVAMIANAIGLPPQGALARCAGNVLWWIMQARGRMASSAN